MKHPEEAQGAKRNTSSDSGSSVASPREAPSGDDDAAAAASTSTLTAPGREQGTEKTFELKEMSLQISPGKLTVYFFAFQLGEKCPDNNLQWKHR